jgi:PTH1 family peptidyl-tRNA hydrolase
VAVLLPQTYMNDAGRSVGPARGAFRAPLDRVLVIHDEIDLPFGRIQDRTGGGVAGHNGLKSVRDGLGSADFRRIRVGVGRPPTTDPERVSAYVLGRFREPRDEVQALIDQAADAAEQVVREGDEPDL